MAWRSVPDPSRPNAEPAEGNGDAKELKRRLADTERARQTELQASREQALQDGLRQGREQAAAEVKAASERLATALAELASLKRKLRQQAEMEMVKLSIAVARRILHRELVIDPDAIQGLVHAALQNLAGREVARVRVAPPAATILRSCLEESGAPSSIVVVPDPGLKIGDVLFETSLGELDASIETQLREIERGFADRLESR